MMYLYEIIQCVYLSKKNLTAWEMTQWLKSSDCSSRGPSFNSPHPQDSSQLYVTPVSEHLTPSQRHNIHAEETKIHIKKET